MKESYQREEYCRDQRKGSLHHFQPSEELGVKLQGREAPRVVIRSQFIGLLTKTAISLKTPCREDFERNRDFTPTTLLRYCQLHRFH